MLMMMRADENYAGNNNLCSDDELKQCIANALTDPSSVSSCIAACSGNEEPDTPTVVKAGDLAITATAAAGRKAIRNAYSDLDTLKFSTSEEVTITKVILERYGYSDADDVDGVQLEDADGNIIAESNTIDNKDRVTLSLKKDYRKVDGNFNATVVVKMDAAASGSTIGFKVVDVKSTAENVNLGNYTPYEYDIVTYDAVTDVTISDKDTAKNYNYEAGEKYQVAKFKVNSNNTAATINGFTLTNAGNLDLDEFLGNVEVLADGTAVRGLSYNYDADDDTLTIAFNDYEIAAKGHATFTVNMSLVDFDEYGDYIHFSIANASDVRMTEKKTGVRVTPTVTVAGADHYFYGSKIKLTNTRLGNVDAAQGSDDVVVLKGNIELTEAIEKVSFDVTPTYSTGSNLIDAMRLIVAGDEYDAHKSGAKFVFSNVEIERAGEVEIVVDINENAAQNATVTFAPTSISKTQIADGTARYTDAKVELTGSQIAGSISFTNKLTIQASKASLQNDLDKDVQFVKDSTARKTVFDGTYTAKKGDVTLDTVEVTGAAYDKATYGDLRFYVSINGEEVAILEAGDPEETISNVLVRDGRSVSVKVEAEVNPEATYTTGFEFDLRLAGKDDNDNVAGEATESLALMKYVEAGSVIISYSSTKDTVLKKAPSTTLATFTVKPANNQEGLYFDTLELELTGTNVSGLNLDDDITVKVNGQPFDPEDGDSLTGSYYLDEELPTEGLEVVVTLKPRVEGEVSLIVKANNSATRTFKRHYADALVYIATQEDKQGFTRYTLGVDKYDADSVVTGLVLYTDTSWTAALEPDGLSTELEDGDTFIIMNSSANRTIRGIKYYVDGKEYKFNSVDFADYFVVGDDPWMVFSNN